MTRTTAARGCCSEGREDDNLGWLSSDYLVLGRGDVKLSAWGSRQLLKILQALLLDLLHHLPGVSILQSGTCRVRNACWRSSAQTCAPAKGEGGVPSCWMLLSASYVCPCSSRNWPARPVGACPAGPRPVGETLQPSETTCTQVRGAASMGGRATGQPATCRRPVS